MINKTETTPSSSSRFESSAIALTQKGRIVVAGPRLVVGHECRGLNVLQAMVLRVICIRRKDIFRITRATRLKLGNCNCLIVTGDDRLLRLDQKFSHEFGFRILDAPGAVSFANQLIEKQLKLKQLNESLSQRLN